MRKKHKQRGGKVTEVKPFDYPEQSANTSSKTPSDQLNQGLENKQKSENSLIDLTEGKIVYEETNLKQLGGKYTFYNKNNIYHNSIMTKKQTGSGRTLNIPKTHPTNTVPGPSFNGAITIGESCKGQHCSIPVTPTTANLINKNLNTANPPPGANVHYPGTNRLGNSSMEMPGVTKYTGTSLNRGPHNINCVQCGSGGGETCECGCNCEHCNEDGCACSPMQLNDGNDCKCSCGCADPTGERFGEDVNGQKIGSSQFGGQDTIYPGYMYIVNPETGRKVSIYGKKGTQVLKNYLKHF